VFKKFLDSSLSTFFALTLSLLGTLLFWKFGNFPLFVLFTGFALSLLTFSFFYLWTLLKTQSSSMEPDFVHKLSRELRTPLAVIKESVSILDDEVLGTLNEKQKDMLDTTRRNVERLSHLIDAVLNYQKLETIKVHPEKK